MKQILYCCIFVACTHAAIAQSNINDGDWKKTNVILTNTPEAEVMIRVGDIDNLNNGFPEGFNPFCVKTTDPHGFPWEVNSNDPAGTDRIMVPSSFKDAAPCGGDGYTGTTSRPDNLPQAVKMNIQVLAGKEISSAAIIMFVDDFQPTQFCGKFEMTLNGQRFYDAERILNALDQTGPVGKMLTIPVSEDLFPAFKESELAIRIDDPTTGAADGFAIDFVKLVINYKPQFTCIGKLSGFVREDGTDAPLANALVEVRGYGEAKTNANGHFSIDRLPAGMQVAAASKEGYEANYKAGDVAEGQNEEIIIYLKKGNKTASFQGKSVRQGESLVMNNIFFDQGSAALRKESMAELDKVADFLKENTGALIELSGHTSSEGSRDMNRSLSFKRVNSCRKYITAKGLAEDRITIVGYGPDKPVASNDTETGRTKNRRVEMKVLKL